MKKLKKFENWIDDESADTNRRIAELDNEEGLNNADANDLTPEMLMKKIDIIFNFVRTISYMDNNKDKELLLIIFTNFRNNYHQIDTDSKLIPIWNMAVNRWKKYDFN